MKKLTKSKLVSLLLVCLMLIAVCPLNTLAADDEAVATVSYFCYVKSPGHCWIYVENLTDETLRIGAYDLAAGEGVSIGSFGTSRHDGYGIYYNVEAYCQTTYGFKSYKTLTEEINRAEFDKLHNEIKKYNNNWNIFRNCLAFATKMWNTVSDRKLSNLLFPAFSSLQVSFKRGSVSNGPVQKSVTADKVFRQKGNGDGAYLVNVSEASLRDIK